MAPHTARRKAVYSLIVSAIVLLGIAIPVSIAQARCRPMNQMIAGRFIIQLAAKIFPVASACGTAYTPPTTFTLTVNVVGSGTVTGSGIDCPGTCVVTKAQYTNIELTPTPAAGYSFDGWSGDCSGTGTCTMSMDSTKNVTATFTQNSQHTLTIITNGPGTVSVTDTLTCIDDCVLTEPNGRIMALKANVLAGYVFGGWSGDCVSATTICDLVMDAPKTVTATFTPLYTLTVSASGSGTVTGSGITCPGICTVTVTENTNIELTAAPASGYSFVGWTGDCAGFGTCALSMTGDKSVTANFVLTNETLTIHVIGLGRVYVSGAYCYYDCAYYLPPATQAYLVAEPNDGHRFLGWSDENGDPHNHCSNVSRECFMGRGSVYVHFTDRW